MTTNTIMKALVSFIALILSTVAIADTLPSLPPTASLVAGNASYQEMLAWAKQKIGSEQKLNTLPIITEESCGNANLVFIQNTPLCGNINCPYLTFRKIQQSDKSYAYRYMGDVHFSAVHLYCYVHPGDYKYYLITNTHETNATSLLELNEVNQDKITRKMARQIDYTKKGINQTMDKLWDGKLTESDLLKLFKK